MQLKTLLVRYGIPDPAAGNAQGEFTNPDLQDLYDQLIQQGSVSKVEALKVGVFIEETDIDDLNAAIATTTHERHQDCIQQPFAGLPTITLPHSKPSWRNSEGRFYPIFAAR